MWSLRKIGHYTLVSGLAAAVGFNTALFTMQATPSSEASLVLSLGPQTGGIEVLHFNLAAVNADFTVSQITMAVAKTGTCAKAGLDIVSLFDVNNISVPLANTAPLTASQKQFVFKNFATPLTITAGTTKALVATNYTPNCTGTTQFSIPSKGVVATYLKPTTTYVGSLKGLPITLSAPSQPSPTAEGQATLAAALDPQAPVGTWDVGFSEVLRFTLKATGTQDVVTNTFNFKPTHSCPSLTSPKATLAELGDNLNVQSVSNLIGSEITANGFSVKDFSRTIKAGTSKTFTLKFDTTGCTQSKNFRMDFVGGKWFPYNSETASTMISGAPVQGKTLIMEMP